MASGSSPAGVFCTPHAGVAGLVDVRVVEILGGIAGHSDPPHHRLRAQVPGHRDSDDLRQPHDVEAVLQRRQRCLGGVTVAPRGPRQPPGGSTPAYGRSSSTVPSPVKPMNSPDPRTSRAQKPKPWRTRSSWKFSAQAVACSKVSSGPRYCRTSGSAFIAAHGARSDSLEAAHDQPTSADLRHRPAHSGGFRRSLAFPIGLGQRVLHLSVLGAFDDVRPLAGQRAHQQAQTALLQHAPGSGIHRHRVGEHALDAEFGEALADQGP